MLSKESIRKFEQKHGRSIQLRRQFNKQQQLLQGGQKRRRDEWTVEESEEEIRKIKMRRLPKMSREDGAKKIANIPAFLGFMDCKDVINMGEVDWDTVPELKYIDDPEYDESYALPKMREMNPTVCKGKERCLKYYAKCMFLHLKKKYGKPSIKECWYEAIRRGNVDYYERFTMITKETSTIGEDTFTDNKLTRVTIPSSVTTIGNGAFSFNKLTSVTFESPSSVTTIGQSAFRWNLLGEVTIPSSVETIDREAFLNNKLTNVTFESASSVSATTNRISRSWSAKSSCIARKAFVGNPLTSITIPSSFEIIENDAFEKQVHIVRE